jgi:hypothetical protein
MAATEVEQKGEGIRPNPGNTDPYLVGAFLEEALVNYSPDWSELTVTTLQESGISIHKTFGHVAVEGMIPTEDDSIDRDGAVGMVNEALRAVLEAALFRIASTTGIAQKTLYEGLYDGKRNPPICSPIQDQRTLGRIKISVWPEGPRSNGSALEQSDEIEESRGEPKLLMPRVPNRGRHSISTIVTDQEYL